MVAWSVNSAIALAQSVDASGSSPSVFSNDLAVPVGNSWLSPLHHPLFVGSQLEFADGSLMRYSLTPDGGIESTPLLDDLFSVSFMARLGLTSRVSVALGAPIWLTARGQEGLSQPAMGDLYVGVPVQLCGDRESRLGCGVQPHVSFPMANEERFLSDGVLDYGLKAGARYQVNGFTGSASSGIGYQQSRFIDGFAGADGQQVGGLYVVSEGALGWVFGEHLGVHFGLRSTVSLREKQSIDNLALSAFQSPAEFSLSVRGQPKSALSWFSSISRGLNAGIGAARWRGVAGVGWGVGERALFGDRYSITIMVQNPAGEPVNRATVRVGNEELGQTDALGRLLIEQAIDWSEGVIVESSNFETVTVPEPGRDADEVVIRMNWRPIPIAFLVQDSYGQDLDAKVEVTDLDSVWGLVSPLQDGTYALAPGRWRLDVSADGYGSQSREINVEPGDAFSEMEIVLVKAEGGTTLVQRILDAQGNPLEGARVLIDGQPVGTTGNGGVFEIGALAPGRHTLTIAADRFVELRQTEIFLDEGTNEFEVSLQRLPGTVQVTARSAMGVVDDAIVRFSGPVRLPAAPLGETGKRQFGPLRPGTWNMLLVSPSYGMQERVIIIPENSYELLEVEVVLQPEEDGDSDLEVRVIDRLGAPVSDAKVFLDGQDMGRLSTGGFMTFQDLKSGIRSIQVDANFMTQEGPDEFLVSEGTQEILIPMRWKAGATLITVRTDDGLVGDATVRFLGPEPREAVDLGPSGRQMFTLSPGEWTLVVSSTKYGLQQRSLMIGPDDPLLHRVDVTLVPEAGGLAELDLKVFDPFGNPVRGAEVLLDGYSQGKTSEAGLKVGQRLVGKRRLEVRASSYRAHVESLELTKGSVSHTVTLDWAPGATRVSVTSGGQPVTNAVVRGVGPAIQPPVPVDADGQRLLGLSPGDWQLIVTSKDYGFSQANVSISETDRGLLEIPVELLPVEAGFGQALFRVRRPDGLTIDGASVLIDGELKGVTVDGNLLCDNLVPGTSKLLVEADSFSPYTQGNLEIAPGSREVIVVLEPRSYPLEVRVVGPDGQPTDAEVSFSGPIDVSAVRTGPSGRFEGELPSGEWQVIASAEGLGPLRRLVSIRPGKKTRVVDLALSASRIEARGKTVIPEKIRFATDSDTLSQSANPILDEVANFVISRPGIIRIEIQGHTDASGRIAYNQELSRRRALAVMQALIERGVAGERLVARGYGTQRPLVAGQTPEAYAKNRRVEFVIIEEYVSGTR